MRSFLRVLSLTSFIVYNISGLQAQEGEAQESVKVAVDKRYQNEMKTLSEKPAIKAAFKTIMALEPETHKNLITLNEIPAPPFKEQRRAEKLWR